MLIIEKGLRCQTYMQANMLASQFHGWWQKTTHETPGPETKDFITHRNSCSQSVCFFLHQFPKLLFSQQCTEGQVTSAHAWVLLQEKTPELREPKSLIMTSKPAYPLLQRGNVSTFHGCLLHTSLKRQSGINSPCLC